jgi:hypothetical protein
MPENIPETIGREEEFDKTGILGTFQFMFSINSENSISLV